MMMRIKTMVIKMKKLILISLLFVLLFSSKVFSLPQKMAERHRFERAEQRHRHRMEICEVRHNGKIQCIESYFSSRAERVRIRGLAQLRLHRRFGRSRRQHRLGYRNGSIFD